MFKAFIGQCKECPPGINRPIRTKRGLCDQHLYAFKQKAKSERPVVTIEGLQKMGYVKKAIDLTTDWASKADELFSEWIRRRYADVRGWVSCFTCDTRKHWRQMTCGHFHKRRHLGTRFEERACEVQCYDCNRDIETNKSIQVTFERKLMLKYGPGILEELELKKNRLTKISQPEYKEMCEELKQKIEGL